MKNKEQLAELSQQIESKIVQVFGQDALFFFYVREPNSEEYSLLTNAMGSRGDLWEINNFTFEALDGESNLNAAEVL